MRDKVEPGKLRVILVSPQMSKTSTGEPFVAFKWAEALQDRVALTVLALQSEKHAPLQQQLPRASVLTWPEPDIFGKHKRFRAMFKPEWIVFSRYVASYLKGRRREFDIGHQIMPQAPRYYTPFLGSGIPYVIGPLGGALSTPQSFKSECTHASWYTRLRILDQLRFQFDPWLRRSYSSAELILGVAPYVADNLSKVPLKRYESILELGIDALAPEIDRADRDNEPLRLLHVGRGVRTKGLRDVVRALAHLRDMPNITLTSAGTGEEIDICKQEAVRLGVAHRVRFLGLIPRDEVEKLYAEADIFVFPSFRESAGNVLYEAMRWGLPIITAARGGPNFIVDETCGIKIPVTEPQQYSKDIAATIARLSKDVTLRKTLGDGARRKVASEGLWGQKADNLVRQYRLSLFSLQKEH